MLSPQRIGISGGQPLNEFGYFYRQLVTLNASNNENEFDLNCSQGTRSIVNPGGG